MEPPKFNSVKEADAWLHKNAIAEELMAIEVGYGPVYEAENGDYVSYATRRLSSGKFAVVVWRETPGQGLEWTYVREFRLRKDAKARCIELYAERSPKWRKRRDRGQRQAGDRAIEVS